MNHRHKILLADDDPGTLKLFGLLLEDEGWQVVKACDGDEVIEKAERENPCVLVLDHRMPGRTGGEAYAELCRRGITIPVVLVSGADDIEAIAALFDIPYFFRKPADIPELLNAIASACNATGQPDSSAGNVSA